MDMPPALTAQLDAATDSIHMRRLVLAALAERAVAFRAHRIALDLPVPGQMSFLVAVLDEASAYWALESARAATFAEFREIAADTYRGGVVALGEILAATLPEDVRSRERAQVVADLRGPGEG